MMYAAPRQICAAPDDHDRRANRRDAVDRRVLENQEKVAEVEERVRPPRLRPEVPREQQHLEHEDRDRAEFARVPPFLHVCAAICITVCSVAASPASSPCTRPCRMTMMRSATVRTSGRSLDTIRQAMPCAAFARM